MVLRETNLLRCSQVHFENNVFPFFPENGKVSKVLKTETIFMNVCGGTFLPIICLVLEKRAPTLLLPSFSGFGNWLRNRVAGSTKSCVYVTSSILLRC